jgi:hypothetical protein
MRLRDLIPALRAQHASAQALVNRIDPSIADELCAVAAHRRIDLMDLAADCLEQLALDAADTIWQLGVERNTGLHDDPEAALLGSILRQAVRTRLGHGYVLSSHSVLPSVLIGFTRSEHPYTMA